MTHIYSVISGTKGARLISVGRILPKEWMHFTIERVRERQDPDTKAAEIVIVLRRVTIE